MKRLIIFLAFIGILLLSGYLLFREGSLPVNKAATETNVFVIHPGDSLDTIARNLASEGFIRNKIVFYFEVKRLDIDKNIQAGDFRLSQGMNVSEVAKALTHGTLDQWVTVIEGLRKEEIAQILSKDMGILEVDFLKYAQEGYLFPDTYLFPKQSTGQTVVELMKENFDTKYTPELRTMAQKNNLSQGEVVILASLLERESKFTDDRQEVANILLKRFKNDWPLQIDATVQYALGYDDASKSWWKEHLSADDLKIDSAYNTYTHTGLPPGPISNPGLSAMNAVANADASTPYWYYVSDKNGKLHFAKTLEEQDANISKYIP